MSEPRSRAAWAGLVGVAVALAACWLAPPVAADVGAAIDPGEVAVRDPLHAGSAVRLPVFRVRNPGDTTTTYRITAGGLRGTSATPAEQSWFAVTPAIVVLEPGATAEVVATIAPAPDTTAGRYVGLITAEVVLAGVGTRVGVAAGTRVFFDVNATDTAAVEPGRGTADNRTSPWLVAGAIGIAAVLVGVGLHLSGFRLKLTRRRPGDT
jgi:hypothetical protein